MKSEKKKTKEILEQTLRDINRTYGDDVIRTLGDTKSNSIDCISSGALTLDSALGGNGFPIGRIIEIIGMESSGKTTLALHIAAEVQKKGGTVAFIDAEHALNPTWAETIGVNIKDIVINQPDCGEQALEIVEKLVTSEQVDLIIVDSVAALAPSAELSGEMGQAHIGLQARLMSQAMRKLTALLHRTNTTIVFINQIRMKVGVMFGCVHGDTLVNFCDGRSVPIQKVVEDKIEGNVWTVTETGDIESKKIIDWHYNGKVENREDYVFIKTVGIENGGGRFGLTVTKDHLVRTTAGWKCANDVRVGDSLISKYRSRFNGSFKDFLSGMLVGDSHLSKKTYNTTIKFQDKSNPNYLEWKRNKLSNVIGIAPTETSQGTRYYTEYCYEMSKLKEDLGKRDPLFLMKENYSDLGLALWMMDDGCFDKRASHERYILSIKRLAGYKVHLDEISNMFFDKVGVRPNINYKSGSLHFTKQDTYKIADRIKTYIPECMQYKLPDDFKGFYEDFELECVTTHKVEPVEVVEKRKASWKQMRKRGKYDLSIEGNQNYMVGGKGNGVIIHNSPETTSGGNALKFYSSVRVDVRRKSTLKDTHGDAYGIRVKARVIKNKIAAPFQVAEFDILFDSGIDAYGCLIEECLALGYIQKAGAWYSIEGVDEKFQGKDAVVKFLKENHGNFEFLIDMCK